MSDAFPEMPSLTVAGGPLDGYEMKLSPGTTVIIGSGRLAHMRLEHPDIELAHVKVSWDDIGISMVDNGSRKGTWLNGEPVETVALLDGDAIEFVAPDSKSTPPKVKVHIPKGSVPEPPPQPPPAPGEAVARPVAARAAAPTRRARGPARRRRAGPRLPDLRLAGAAAGALLLLVGGGLLTRWLFFTAPQVVSIEPGEAEPGRVVTVKGKRFDSDAADNVVWFGDRSVPALSSAGGTLQAKVPPMPRPGRVPVMVETSAGRSRPVSFAVLVPLMATTLDPAGALAGDEVVLGGTGFADGVTVTVGGVPAPVLAAEPSRVRFRMPAVEGSPGKRLDVLASVGSRRTSPLPLYLGRTPLVASFEPPRGVIGDLLRIRGAGFAPSADDNVVTFDDVPALVLAASPLELAVVVPPPVHPRPEVLARVVVQAEGKTSSDGAVFPLQRLVEGTWVLRFLAGAVGRDGAKGQAVVGTEVAPVLLLSGKDDARSVGERAWRVAAALNAAVDRARVGQAVDFEVREAPSAGVALRGAPELLVKVTPEDAAAYEAAPGVPARGAPPTPIALARHWAALLGDTLVVGTSGGKPTATADVTPAASTAFAQLRAALPWQYGSGIPNARVVAVPGDLKRRLREAAFRVP
jgi:hypothetical protein